jgi:hypothetical protein
MRAMLAVTFVLGARCLNDCWRMMRRVLTQLAAGLIGGGRMDP